MILESFEIENWSCIRHVAVDNLPPTGIVVLHGCNGTGKSSIIAALRACLFDFQSSSKDSSLRRWFPKNIADKPRVSVVFRCGDRSWRITKQFNSKESKLECRTATGGWKIEATSASEAHERTCELVGGRDSSAGLQQLLWLTQAEFHLPEPKKFDASIQSQLRGVLGVLQTSLDDRFIKCVRQEWARWFSARTKPGKKPDLKDSSSLAKNLAALEACNARRAEFEREFAEVERMLDRLQKLEITRRGLQRQLEDKTAIAHQHQEEFERSLARLEAHALAGERVTHAAKALGVARDLLQQRAFAESEAIAADKNAEAARVEVEERAIQLQQAEEQVRELRERLDELHAANRELQARRDRVEAHGRTLELQQRVDAAQAMLRDAQRAADELAELARLTKDQPAPEETTLRSLETNRSNAAALRAELEAASIRLILSPDSGQTGTLTVDSGRPEPLRSDEADRPSERHVRRRAELAISGWGRIEIARGTDARNLDQIENEITQLDREFAERISAYGVNPADAACLDCLRMRAADQRAREPAIEQKRKEIARLAPKGIESLRSDLDDLQRQKLASDLTARDDSMPSNSVMLDALARELKETISANAERMGAIQTDIEQLEQRIGLTLPRKQSSKGSAKLQSAVGLREAETIARRLFDGLSAEARLLREQLERMKPTTELEQAVSQAEKTLALEQERLEQGKLTDSETTIRERFDAAKRGVKSIEQQLVKAKEEFDQITGEMRRSEGLHQKRAAATARVEELVRVTQREALESNAYHLLLELFEDCRDKQLDAVMGPIQQRVMRWIRLLGIGDYGSLHFNDQFLPEKLTSRDGAKELALLEESTGTIEQIGLMVRLALGSTLATAGDPAVAILDDPLTHSDVVRLDRMRAVLRSAAAGDPTFDPPAGPLQVLIFTCHPEWFDIEGANVVDLSDPRILQRSG